MKTRSRHSELAKAFAYALNQWPALTYYADDGWACLLYTSREIDHLQAQLDKLRRMNFGSRSEKVSRRIAQMEAALNRLQKESDRARYADW